MNNSDMVNDSKKVLHLEITLESKQLSMSVREYARGQEDTIRNYEQIPVSMDRMDKRCREMVETLNRANRNGRLGPRVLTKLKEVGQIFFDEFFPLSIKEKLNDTNAEYLKLDISDQLVHIPWELVNNGEFFLCNRFNMGRMVKTRQAVLSGQPRELSSPLKALILADPEGDLQGAYKEGTQIRDTMDMDRERARATLRAGNINTDFVQKKIRQFDLIHFAGHAHYDRQFPEKSGWRLSGDTFLAEDAIKMAGSAANSMPALIFSNACQSASTGQWTLSHRFNNEIFGLANAFLLAGVKHYIGTFWEILDEPSSHFALSFYRHILAGKTTGEAVRLARHATIKAYGEETVVWASYLLYGDPTFQYLENVGAEPEWEEIDKGPVLHDGEDAKTRRDVVHFPEKKKKKSMFLWLGAFALVIISVAAIWGFQIFSIKQIARYEVAAITCYEQGKFQEALGACRDLKKKRPESTLAYLLEGHILLKKGRLVEAKERYQKTLDLNPGNAQHKAEALSGLGRIASLQNDLDQALEYYGKATNAYPRGKTGYMSQALVLENQGKVEEALALLSEAEKSEAADPMYASLVNELSRKVALSSKLERQKYRNQLLKDISGAAKTSKAAPGGWTSFPVTMLVKEFEIKGYSFDEGADRLLVSSISNQLLEKSRVRIVERGLLNDLLEEFKLGNYDMVDPATALSTGKILAARLVLTGHISYSEQKTRVVLRLIETETSRVVATINESFGTMTPVAVSADKLAGELLKTIQEFYPLRGEILETIGDTVTLNIGSNVGVRKSEAFKVIDTQTILEVYAVSDVSSLSKSVKEKAFLKKGMRVEVLAYPLQIP